ncbi:MAG: hypothetical protein NT014_04650, partial [Candidatus Omnitrophica bacterium]|nr:hypothetical protein [Candidatus Omnitrophota bacterium]
NLRIQNNPGNIKCLPGLLPRINAAANGIFGAISDRQFDPIEDEKAQGDFKFFEVAVFIKALDDSEPFHTCSLEELLSEYNKIVEKKEGAILIKSSSLGEGTWWLLPEQQGSLSSYLHSCLSSKVKKSLGWVVDYEVASSEEKEALAAIKAVYLFSYSNADYLLKMVSNLNPVVSNAAKAKIEELNRFVNLKRPASGLDVIYKRDINNKRNGCYINVSDSTEHYFTPEEEGTLLQIETGEDVNFFVWKKPCNFPNNYLEPEIIVSATANLFGTRCKKSDIHYRLDKSFLVVYYGRCVSEEYLSYAIGSVNVECIKEAAIRFAYSIGVLCQPDKFEISKGAPATLLRYMCVNKIFSDNPRKSKEMAGKRGGNDSLSTIQRELRILRIAGLVDGDSRVGYYLPEWLRGVNIEDIIEENQELEFPDSSEEQVNRVKERINSIGTSLVGIKKTLLGLKTKVENLSFCQ